MTTIVTFDQSRCRRPNTPHPGLKAMTGPAKVLLFTGVRRELLLPRPMPYEPMFNDPAPDKPSGKKRRRGKSV